MRTEKMALSPRVILRVAIGVAGFAVIWLGLATEWVLGQVTWVDRLPVWEGRILQFGEGDEGAAAYYRDPPIWRLSDSASGDERLGEGDVGMSVAEYFRRARAAGGLADEPESGDDKLKPSANVTVQIQSDFVWNRQGDFNESVVGAIPDGAFFRRARLGVFGELYKTVEYRLEFDFAEAARPRFLDNWIALTDIPVVRNVIVGHFFEPFSLERYSPNRFITFNERSLADSFAPARNMGAMVYGNLFDSRSTCAAGVFRSNSDDYGADVSFNEGYAATAHATILPWFEEVDKYTRRLLHLGSSFSYRLPGDDPFRFSSRPSARLRQEGVGGIPVFVDTGNIDDVSHQLLLGVEAAWVHGPISVQSEWIATQLNRYDQENPQFHGGYLYGSWFLTGESRSYSPTSILGRFREGIFQRVEPKSNFFDKRSSGGWTGTGAVELAVRWSYIDLNSLEFAGGSMQEMTYGVNWYLNPNTRVSFNYVRPILAQAATEATSLEMYTMRFQFEF